MIAIDRFAEKFFNNKYIENFNVSCNSDPDAVRRIIDLSPIKAPAAIAEWYQNYIHFAFEWHIEHNKKYDFDILEPDFDVVAGASKIIDASIFWGGDAMVSIVHCLISTGRPEEFFVNLYPFEHVDGEYVVFFTFKDNHVLDEMWFYDLSENSLTRLSIEIKEYLELMLLLKGFYGWQISCSRKDRQSLDKIIYYINHIFAPDKVLYPYIRDTLGLV